MTNLLWTPDLVTISDTNFTINFDYHNYEYECPSDFQLPEMAWNDVYNISTCHSMLANLFHSKQTHTRWRGDFLCFWNSLTVCWEKLAYFHTMGWYLYKYTSNTVLQRGRQMTPNTKCSQYANQSLRITALYLVGIMLKSKTAKHSVHLTAWYW